MASLREEVEFYVEAQMTEFLDWVVNRVPEIVAGVVIILIGYRLSKTAVSFLGRPVYNWVQRESIAKTVLRLVRYSVITVSVLVSARIAFGISLTSVFLTATVFSAVLGIILAPLVGDIINGVFVLGDQPYEIGDMIELVDTGERGFVDDVTIRYTKIFTMDNSFLVIPNSEIRKRDVNNYSAGDLRTRDEIDVTVSYESDADKAREIMRESAREMPEVISTHGNIRIGHAEYPLSPRCFISEFGDHGIRLTLRYWLREPYYIAGVKSEINQKVRRKFEREGVDIPYPHSHLVIDDERNSVSVRREDEGDEDTGATDIAE